jgi:hypothetical protein
MLIMASLFLISAQAAHCLNHNLYLHKKSVFDLISLHNSHHAHHKYQDSKTMKTRLQLQNSLITLWNQYHGNWIAINGKITLLNTFFKTKIDESRIS